MIRLGRIVCCAVLLLAALPDSTFAQKSVADVLGRPATPEGQPKTYFEELMLFSWIRACVMLTESFRFLISFA